MVNSPSSELDEFDVITNRTKNMHDSSSPLNGINNNNIDKSNDNNNGNTSNFFY